MKQKHCDHMACVKYSLVGLIEIHSLKKKKTVAN